MTGLAATAGPRLGALVGRHPYFALREVVVRNAHRVPADEVRAVARIVPGMSVWDVDVGAAAGRLRAHEWVRGARVRRELPHRVVIEVREERPVAVVAVAGNGPEAGEFYVSSHGRIFARVAARDGRDLPYITGLGTADLADGDAFGPRALRRAVGLARRSGGLEVSEVHVDRVRGLTLMPVRPPIPIELGWTGFDVKLARLPRVLKLWAGREAEIAGVGLVFPDEVIIRTRAVPKRRVG
ncbi:MAG TPA: FtsQ-type POTRA domain-containing protein [Candidatus Binatia bacterium]|nr:FtsQ-type POTRA domain-containing protein [Candidatus Binatia bacterium]